MEGRRKAEDRRAHASRVCPPLRRFPEAYLTTGGQTGSKSQSPGHLHLQRSWKTCVVFKSVLFLSPVNWFHRKEKRRMDTREEIAISDLEEVYIFAVWMCVCVCVCVCVYLLVSLFDCARSQLRHTGPVIFIETCESFSCGMRTLSCSKWDLVPRSGIKSSPLHWEHRVLATGPPGRSRWTSFCYFVSYTMINMIVTKSWSQSLIISLSSFLETSHSTNSWMVMRNCVSISALGKHGLGHLSHQEVVRLPLLPNVTFPTGPRFI